MKEVWAIENNQKVLQNWLE